MYAFAEDLFIEEAEVRFYGFRLQTRMAVAVLPDRRLLLYSPVWLTPRVSSELGQLGEVTYILSPNKIHNQTLAAYAEAYPDAEIHVPPGLMDRCPDLRVSGTLVDQAPSAPWKNQLDQVLTSGNVFFSEAVLFHRPSRTLLVGDLIENLDLSSTSALGRATTRLFGVGREPVVSPEFRFYTHDPEAAAQSFARITSWDFERIFLCHGSLITEDAKEVVQLVTDNLLHTARGRTRVARWVLRGLARLQ